MTWLIIPSFNNILMRLTDFFYCSVIFTSNSYFSSSSTCTLTNIKSHKDVLLLYQQAFIIYLAIPAMSAPVKRFCSISKKIFRLARCSLSDALFQNLMFVRCYID